jgi:hypothetical protein
MELCWNHYQDGVWSELTSSRETNVTNPILDGTA